MTKKKMPVRRRRQTPVYLQIRRLKDPITGSDVGALVPSSWADQRLMRERGYKVGDSFRAELTKPRNSNFHRLVHQLGILVVENIEEFKNLQSHEAIKRLQRESGVCCDEQEFELPGIGKLMMKTAQSLAFDSMDEAQFQYLWKVICDFIAARYWKGLDAEKITEMVELMPQQPGVGA